MHLGWPWERCTEQPRSSPLFDLVAALLDFITSLALGCSELKDHAEGRAFLDKLFLVQNLAGEGIKKIGLSIVCQYLSALIWTEGNPCLDPLICQTLS